MKIAFIGGGNMAAALIGGLIKRGVAPADLYAVDLNDEARARTAEAVRHRDGRGDRRDARRLSTRSCSR